MPEILTQLSMLTRAMMQVDGVYNDHAARSGLSASAFWLFYALLDRERTSADDLYTQRGFCREWSFSPQTVNSSLKKMREQGFVELVSLPGVKREKGLRLTEKGRAEAVRLVGPLVEAECRSLAQVPGQDRETLIRALGLYRQLLADELSKL